MSTPAARVPQIKQGAEDSGRFFKYMAEFVGFTDADAETIRQTRPIIEKHVADIVGKFYTHLLRYPPTRKFFLKSDGSIDHDYIELRMRHLTNFWLRTACGIYDDAYARYIDYVGRAHTCRGADPSIYIAERYVIGQVGFVQHAVSEALMKELHEVDEDFEHRAVEAWDKLLMVILELLSRAYGNEREAETFDPLVMVDEAAVARLAAGAYAREQGDQLPVTYREVVVARVDEIPEGERKIVQVDNLSVGVFHHRGAWHALRNSCLHRGGPVATGCLEGDILSCPWHGFQYNVTSGRLLVDPSSALDMYTVVVEGDEVRLRIPETTPTPAPARPALPPNAFPAAELAPGQIRLVQVDGQDVAVYNVEGTFYATQSECTHMGGPLDEGELQGGVVSCPWHDSRFCVSDGSVVEGPAREPLETFRVSVDGEIVRVEKQG